MHSAALDLGRIRLLSTCLKSDVIKWNVTSNVSYDHSSLVLRSLEVPAFLLLAASKTRPGREWGEDADAGVSHAAVSTDELEKVLDLKAASAGMKLANGEPMVIN